ncbi:actin, putative [Theileria equi strain WA]|uniref:Actin, putative n=1 Tax=Theileria equi strain WA TaxID=1537102 RepID=L1LF38_THEEQ|nr:actin, putative [Theileria equi strain WA]EKX73855.1 actin, putative [Theileria equi strain WA]|eukprot:XP_004833307.1 actin, putative [Theileria equi strain WA]
MSDEQCVIIDNGSGTIKVGLTGSSTPSFAIPSVIGTPRAKFKEKMEDEYYGDEAIDNIDFLSLEYPIDHGHISDFDAMEKLWDYSFKRLGIHSDCRPALLTEPPFCSPNHRIKMAEIFFEKFNVDDLNISVSGLLAMYGLGRLTGTILDIGEGVTQCLPVIEGYIEKGSIQRVDFGGLELTMYLQKMLCERGYYLTSRADFELVRKIKEEHCFCSLDPYKDENRSDLHSRYTLPDGSVLRDGETNEIELTLEKFYVCEALFNPTIVHSDAPSIVKTVWNAITNSPIQQRTTLTDNIFISGGSSLFENIDKRLEMELRDIAPPGGRSKIKVTAPPDRHTLSWKGGSILSEPNLKDISSSKWISKMDWEESGAEIVLQKSGFD